MRDPTLSEAERVDYTRLSTSRGKRYYCHRYCYCLRNRCIISLDETIVPLTYQSP